MVKKVFIFSLAIGAVAAILFNFLIPTFYSSKFYLTGAAEWLCTGILFFSVSLLVLLFELLRKWPHERMLRRKKAGLCLNCGYDLRGGVERCPECGVACTSSAATDKTHNGTGVTRE